MLALAVPQQSELPALTAPVSMSYMRAPRLHQSTARLWPLLIRISGALRETRGVTERLTEKSYEIGIHQCTKKKKKEKKKVTNMYSIVPQKVWVTVPSWMDSLHRPKSVSLTCPKRRRKRKGGGVMKSTHNISFSMYFPV